MNFRFLQCPLKCEQQLVNNCNENWITTHCLGFRLRVSRVFTTSPWACAHKLYLWSRQWGSHSDVCWCSGQPWPKGVLNDKVAMFNLTLQNSQTSTGRISSLLPSQTCTSKLYINVTIQHDVYRLLAINELLTSSTSHVKRKQQLVNNSKWEMNNNSPFRLQARSLSSVY